MEAAMAAEQEQLPPRKPRPWGIWATLAFSLVIGAVYLLCAVVYGIAFILAAKFRDPAIDIEEYARTFTSGGLYLASLQLVVLGPVVGLILLFARIRRGITTTEYLRLCNPGWKKLSGWLLFILACAALTDTVTHFSGRDIVHESMIKMYETAHFKPLLWLGLVLAAPVVEEAFFRGFLFKGIECSRLGPIGAVVLTALGWSLLHTQYEAFYIAGTFVHGLILGWALLKSRSIYVPITMHMLWNLIAMVELVVHLKPA
jgi:membrane protease YdiL (CAAX protease family)